MRMPRMTTRRWMAAVLAVAIALTIGIKLGRRRREYLRRAAWHAELGRYGGDIFGDGVVLRSRPRTRPRIMTSLKRIEHHQRLAEKYRDASVRPWLPVEPDPPEPDL